MSIPDFSALRAALCAWAEQHGEGAYAQLSARMGGTPTDEALRQFAKGQTKAPRYAEALADALGGVVTEPDLASEAEQALRLIRQGQDRLARVVERIRAASPEPVILDTMSAMLSESAPAEKSAHQETGPATPHTALRLHKSDDG
jgi:hypothetical protein